MLEIWFEPAWIESFGCETSIDSFKVSYRGLTCLEWELTDDLKKKALCCTTPRMLQQRLCVIDVERVDIELHHLERVNSNTLTSLMRPNIRFVDHPYPWSKAMRALVLYILCYDEGFLTRLDVLEFYGMENVKFFLKWRQIPL
jgi:hypothetical protein